MSEELFSEFETPPSLNLDEPDSDADGADNLVAKPGNVRPRIQGFTRLAWLVVIALTALTTSLAIMSNWMQTRSEVTAAELADIKGSGQMILALKEAGWFSEFMDQYGGGVDAAISGTLSGLNYGPIERRFGFAILVNEARGPVEALAELKKTRDRAETIGVEYSDSQIALEEIIVRVLNGYADARPADLGETDREEKLTTQLGWAGELLLSPEFSTDDDAAGNRQTLVGKAKQSVNFIIGMLAGMAIALATGTVVLFVFGWLLSAGRIRSRMADDSHCGPVYIETFAIWFALFFGMSILSATLPPVFAFLKYSPMIVPLISLAWPMWRGVSFSDFCSDIGLQPVNPVIEIAAGIAGYLAMLPFLAVGLVVTFLLSSLIYLVSAPNEFAPVGVPHPIAHDVAGGDPFWTLIRLLLLTAVAAPLIEEIMFRGVLFRHLRDASHHMTRWVSVLFASLFNGLIFAAIHPQGIAGIPALVILAVGFCLVRQWRGSLIASMTMHALHNGILTFMLMRMLF